MKKSFFVCILLGFSLSNIPNFGVSSVQSASAQVFRCSDTTLGQDTREEVRGEDARSESTVAIGNDCDNANFHEQINEDRRRDAELEKQRTAKFYEQINERRNADSQLKKQSDAAFDKLVNQGRCEMYGVRSPECKDPELKRQAQQEDEIARQRQLQADQIKKEAEREKTLRGQVETARSKIRSCQESIAFWSDHSSMSEPYKKMLPIYEAELPRAEKELQDYLAQKQSQVRP